MNKQGTRNLEIGIALSAVLHVMILYALRFGSFSMPALNHHENNYIQLSTVPPESLRRDTRRPAVEHKNKAVAHQNRPQPVIKNQIVDIPRPLVQQEPKKTAYLSNWSQAVPEEMVSRHKGGGYGTDNQKSLEVSVTPKVPPAGAGQARQEQNSTQHMARHQEMEPGQPGLSLSPQATVSQGQARTPQSMTSSQPGNNDQLALNSMLPSYSRMSAIPGIGDNNYLPGLKEGDVTLLNTKSFVYAGFVRRVAYRIFDRFIFDMRNSDVTQEDLSTMNGYAYVEANMSPEGKLLSVRLLKSSGSPAWDNLAIAACKRATWDANPPRGAEGKDGIIHFVFAPGRDVLVVGLLD